MPGSLVDRSGSITVGGTSQQLAAAKSQRQHLFIQNLSSENLWINFGVAAVADQPSIRIEPGASYVAGPREHEGEYVTPLAVNIIGATTGSKFTAKEVI
jgi:hypothetical protein